jgi:hypothetical protein
MSSGQVREVATRWVAEQTAMGGFIGVLVVMLAGVAVTARVAGRRATRFQGNYDER